MGWQNDPVVPKAPAWQSDPVVSQPMGPSGATWGGVDNYAHGVLMGLGDEAKAVVNATKEVLSGGPLSWSDYYSQAKSMYDSAKSKYRDENPKTAFATEVAGGLTNAVLGGSALKAAGVTMAPAVTLGGRMARNAAAGGALGGVYGFNEGEDGFLNRAQSGAAGLALGAGFGALATPAIEAASYGLKRVYDAVAGRMPWNQMTVAERQVAEKLVADYGDDALNQAGARLRELNAATGGNASIMDLGPATMGKARAAYSAGGEGKKTIVDFLTARQEGTRNPSTMMLEGGQGNRVLQGLDSLTGTESATTARAGIEATRKGFGTNYETAKASGEVVDIAPLLNDIDNRLSSAKGGIKSALDRARSYLVDAKGNPEISIDALHNAKIAIDDLIGNTGDTSIGNVARGALKDVQKQLVAAIEKVSPDYAAGRTGTAAQWALNDALELGGKFVSGTLSPAEFSASLSKMSADQKHMVRVGVVQSIKDKLGNLTTRQDVTKKLLDIPALEQKVAAAFDDPQTFAGYVRMLEGEKALFAPYAKILGNSKTAEAVAEEAALRLDPGRIASGLRDIATMTPTGVARGAYNTVGGLADFLVAPPSPVARNLSELLTRTGPQAEKALADLGKQMSAAQLSLASKRSLAKLLAQGTGIEAGR